MNCKDCIYYSKCRDVSTTDLDCRDFLSKDLLYKLPVKLGTPVYMIRKCTCNTNAIYAPCSTDWDYHIRKGLAVVSQKDRKSGIWTRYIQTCYKLYRVPFNLSYINKPTIFFSYDSAIEKMREYGNVTEFKRIDGDTK